MLLARQGHSVLLVDRATFPSDTISQCAAATSGTRQAFFAANPQPLFMTAGVRIAQRREFATDCIEMILSDGTSAFIGLVFLDVWEWTPLLFLILLAGIQSMPVEPFEAALVDGAGAWRSFVDHTLPLLRPSLVSAALLAFITSFDEFLVAYFLSGTEATLPIYIWGQLRFPERLPMVLALGALILTGSVALVVLAEYVRNLGVRKPMVGA